MLEKDYIMRMIQQLSIVLAKIIFNKEIKNYEQALLEIDKSLNSLLGLNRIKIAEMTENELFDYLDKIGGENAEKYFVLAELLREEGEICELNNRGDFLTSLYYEKAFTFYIQAFCYNDTCPGENLLKLKFVAEKLLADELYEEKISSKWFLYYERIGQNNNAEDVLFHLLDDGFLELKSKGREFYNRLLQKADKELESGGLSRQEIRESLVGLNKY